MVTSPDLNDALCWLEQAGAIIDYIADQLSQDGRHGSAMPLSLFGASSLLDRARVIVDAENESRHSGPRAPQREQ